MKTTSFQAGFRSTFPILAALAAFAVQPQPVLAQAADSPPPALTYADLADLSDMATMVVKAQIRKQTTLAPAQSPGVRPGWARLYFEAQTQALIGGNAPIGESLKFLADVKLDAKGKVPKLRKKSVLLFAFEVPGRPDQLQMVDLDSMIMADEQTEGRVRAVLRELVSPDAKPAISGVGEALAVKGNLDGESETQIFLETENGAPVSLSIIRRPGMEPQWGVSWTDIVDQAAQPPAPNTLEWYRLACFLPDSLPYSAILSRDGASRVLAAQDYRFVLDELGACPRNRP